MKNNSMAVFLLILFSLLSCKQNEIAENSRPELSVQIEHNGFEIQLIGFATDKDGSIKDFIIDWGDGRINHLTDIDYSKISEKHYYANEGDYLLSLSIVDNSQDTTFEILPVVIDYKPSSLENIKPTMFKVSSNEFLILTINLHTYQEEHQLEKNRLLVDLVGKLDVDFIALQECAQKKNSTLVDGIIREDNMALILRDNLQKLYSANYFFSWNWAHYGWDVWEEGIAVLSKYPLINTNERYISSSTSRYNISSRKVIFGEFQTSLGNIHLFSTHTHWRTSEIDEEQNNQIRNIKDFVENNETSSTLVSIVCGDFNGNPTSDYPWSEGYNTMMEGGSYIDSYLSIYPHANDRPANSVNNTIGGDFPGRIDYIFVKENSMFKIVDSQIIFTDDVVGRISDHFGVLTKIALIEK